MREKNDITCMLQVKHLNSEETAEVSQHFSEDSVMLPGPRNSYVRVGPKGYFFTSDFLKEAPKIYNMPLRSDDTWVITFPKSGTTWTQELVWLVANDLDYAKAVAVPLQRRYQFLEMSTSERFGIKRRCLDGIGGDDSQHCAAPAVNQSSVPVKEVDEKHKNENDKKTTLKDGPDLLLEMPSPRFVKTHLPLSLLPADLLRRCKALCVARDPRDVAVSYYHHHLLFKAVGYTGDFKQFWNLFINDMLDWTPYFENVKEAWEQRHNPNMLFLFYEDLLQDLPSAVNRVAAFLGKTLTEEQVGHLCQHLDFKNFKNNKSVNFEFCKELGLLNKDRSFMRKGKAGGWREYFDEEMTRQAERWMADNLRDTDLRFPTID